MNSCKANVSTEPCLGSVLGIAELGGHVQHEGLIPFQLIITSKPKQRRQILWLCHLPASLSLPLT